MSLLDRLLDNYEVPVALVFGILFILLYKRILKDNGEDENRNVNKRDSQKAPGETKDEQHVVKRVQFDTDIPRKLPKPVSGDQIDSLPKTTDVASLHAAVKNGDVDVVRSMLEGGADPNIPDRDSNTSLHIIFQDISTMPLENANEIYELLLKNNITGSEAGVNVVNRNGKTPLHLAVGHTTPYLVRLLLDSGADRNIPDKDGNTPLHTIIEYMQFSQVPAEKEIFDLLVKHWPCAELGDDDFRSRPGINALNTDNLTPLHMAVMYEEFDNVRVLLEEGADPNISDSEGNTPLHTMMVSMKQDEPLSPQNRQMLTLLLNAKADLLLENKKGQSVLCLATNPDVEEEIMKT